MPKGYPKNPRPIRQCSIDGCDAIHFALGWCKMHHTRWRRWGDPLIVKVDHGKNLRWLRDALENRDRSECWEWPFSLRPEGYGQLRFQGKTETAHVVALILDGNPRPAPPGHHTLHSCDNKPCCNPAHLRWGTAKENSADMIAKGRGRYGVNYRQSNLETTQITSTTRITITSTLSTLILPPLEASQLILPPV